MPTIPGWQIRDGTVQPVDIAIYAADGGASDAYAISFTPALATYPTGIEIVFKANTANTGVASLNVNSLGAKTIKKNGSADLADNDIVAGQIVTVVYDGTYFQLQSPVSNVALTNPMSALGDVIYGGTAGAATRLAGDTSNTRKFLREVSSGGVAAAPAWDTLQAGDIPAIAESGVTSLTTDLAAKAPLASPTFTGIPAAPTATAGTNTTQVATTAFVTSAVSAGGNSGAVVQSVTAKLGTVATGTTVIPLDNTIPQNTEGDQYLTATITPTSATNRLFIEFDSWGCTTGVLNLIAALFQDATAGALAASAVTNSNTNNPVAIVLRHEMAAGTTSATTFKIRIGPNTTSTVTINGSNGVQYFGGVAATVLRVTELKA